MKLRPHHGLCLNFFGGEGYSPQFIENMAFVKACLNDNDPVVELTDSVDVICAACPHNIRGRCESFEKVSAYDRAVLSAISAEEGNALRWSEFSAALREHILDCGKLCEICGDCAWFRLCK